MSEASNVAEVHDVPDAVRGLITLGDPDHVDLFTVPAPGATEHSALRWARAILEEAPASRDNARRFWRLLGLRLGPPHSPDHVQGWKIVAREESWIRLETTSWYLTAQAVCLVEAEQVSLSLSLRYRRRIAALVWALASGPHRRAVPVMLRQAVQVLSP